MWTALKCHYAAVISQAVFQASPNNFLMTLEKIKKNLNFLHLQSTVGPLKSGTS
jgi:hypothetical protein